MNARPTTAPTGTRTTHLFHGVALFALLAGLWSAAGLFPWAASILPGIKPMVPPHELFTDALLYAVVGAGTALMPLMLATSAAGGPDTASLGPFLREVGQRFRRSLTTLLTVLGVRRYSARELGRFALIASAWAVVMQLLIRVLVLLPFGPGWAPSPTDPRTIAINDASLPVQILHDLINAPIVEEIGYRGPIMLAAFLLATAVTKRGLKTTLLVVVAVVGILVFASHHALGSGSNVAIAGAAGAVLTWLALRYQTLLPGIMLHALYNAIPEF